MVKTRRRVYVLLAIWACVLALGIGVQMSHAEALDSSCGSVCATQCANEGGCGFYWTFGCSCFWICDSGKDGSQICTS